MMWKIADPGLHGPGTLALELIQNSWHSVAKQGILLILQIGAPSEFSEFANQLTMLR